MALHTRKYNVYIVHIKQRKLRVHIVQNLTNYTIHYDIRQMQQHCKVSSKWRQGKQSCDQQLTADSK